MFPDWLIPVASFIAGYSGIVWGLAWFLSNKFIHVNRNLDGMRTAILDKLEYHERHDDSRFSEIKNNIDTRLAEINNDIWVMRVRNAVNDSKNIKETDSQ